MEDIIQKRKKLIDEKYELYSRLRYVEKDIKKLDEIILKECKHEFIRIKENGIYGETFYKCKHCDIYR